MSTLLGSLHKRFKRRSTEVIDSELLGELSIPITAAVDPPFLRWRTVCLRQGIHDQNQNRNREQGD